jgi:hypothetical protein
MRKLYVSIIAVLASLASFAADITAVGGNWNQAGSWSPTAPSTGDIIIIPSGVTVTVGNNVVISNVTIRVYGVLNVTNKLNLGSTWNIAVYTGGNIQGNGQIVNSNTNNNIYSGSGTITGPQVASSSSSTFVTNTTLPVKFTGFSVARQNSDVLVQWATAEEVNALSYEVERSTDGGTWNRIATVSAKGNTSSLTNYSFTDNNVSAAVAYYRVKQVDVDGKFVYSATQAVKSVTGAVDVKVAAINNRVVLQFSAPAKGDVEVRLVSLSGQVVSKQVLRQPVGQVVLNTATVKGNYIISVSNAQDINVAKQVVL